MVMNKLVTLCCICFAFLAKAQQPGLTVILPVGHSGGVYDAIYSPDYQYILTRDRFEVPRVWNAQTGHLLANLYGHNGRVYRMGYSNDGKLFFTAGSEDSTIIIRRTKDVSIVHVFKTNGETVQGGNFNEDGSRFIAAADDVRIWDMATGKLLSIFSPGKGTASYDYELGTPLINRNGIVAMINSSEKEGFFRYYWNINTNDLLAITKYNDISQTYEIQENKIDDLAVLEPESASWRYPRLFSLQDNGLQFHLDSNDVWITDSLKLVKRTKLAAHTAITQLFYFTGDSTLVAEPKDKLYAGVWNTATMQMPNTLFYEGITRPNLYTGESEANVVFSNDRSLAVQLVENNFAVYDVKAMKVLSQFNQPSLPGKLKYAFFSNGDSMLVTTRYAEKDAAILWNIQTGKPIRSFDFDKDDLLTYACFSPDNSLLALFGWGRNIKIYEVASGRLITTINKNVGSEKKDVFGGGISTNKNMIFFIDNNALFRVFDIKTGKQLYALDKEPGNYVNAAVFAPDNKHLVIGTAGSINKVVELPAGVEKFRFFQVDSTDYLTLVPGGFYQATPGAAKLIHYVTKDLKVITFDQLDIKFNRPDKVQEAIGNRDKLLIQSYRKAFEKRIKKLGIDTTQFGNDVTVPQCNFVEREKISFTQQNDELSLKIVASDAKYDLSRFNVWVNDVPLFGMRGIHISSGRKTFDTSISIKLSNGQNRVETSVNNINGVESMKMPLYVQQVAKKMKVPLVHFIGIGINRFANPEYNLSWSVKDIRDLAVKLKQKYPAIIIDTLFNEDVSRQSILALKQKLMQLGEDDKVIVSYSGHGVLSKDFDYFLSTHSINFNDPAKNGLGYDELESLLDNIRPRQKLMLIDACHSGEVDKEELQKIEAAKEELNQNGVSTRSTIKVLPKKNIGMTNSVELMQNLFVNVSKGTGATIISAAGGMQYALERGDLKNGVFTYSIIEAFNTNVSLKVSELKKIVSSKVAQLTNGLQKPTSRNETSHYDWVVW